MDKQCANFHCDKHIWSKHIRCASCRYYDLNKCVDCDMNTSRCSFYCKDCRTNHYNERINKYKHIRNNDAAYPQCVMCYTTLPGRRMKLCLDSECKRIYANIWQQVIRDKKRINDLFSGI